MACGGATGSGSGRTEEHGNSHISFSSSSKQDPGCAAAETAQQSAAAAAAAAASQKLSALSLMGAPQLQHPALSSCDMQGVAQLIRSGRARRIVVMAGAGISVSAGIPDFRSPGTGLYSQLQRLNLPWPEAVFDLRYYMHDPQPFCTLAKELWPGYHKHAPTPTHHFLRLLSDRGLLLTVFTQNIDGLEGIAGLPAERVVNAHGSFDGAHCINCKQACSIYAVQAAVFSDEVPTCSSCGGLVKPDITFFGEALPARFHRRRLADMQQADLLLVLGTSLKVQPFASMIDQVPAGTPRVLINRTKAGEAAPPQQQQQPQQQQDGAAKQHPCGPSCKLTRHKLLHGTDSSDSDGDSVDDSRSEGASVSPSDASPSLTAASSIANIADDTCSCDADSSTDSSACSQEASAAASEAAKAGSSSSARGFDFDSCGRDVLHLADCDHTVWQLAALLGWRQELEGLIDAGDAAFKEARACWEEEQEEAECC